jgi:hypothetical protein
MMKTINLENPGTFSHNETLEHPAFIRKITGIDPFENPQGAFLAAAKKLDFDWLYSVPKKAFRFSEGESKKKVGNDAFVTEWGYTGSTWASHKGFDDEEKVYSYDPFAIFSSENEIRVHVQNSIRIVEEDQKLAENTAVITGLYYTTLFQWPIMVFGWEPFLTAAVLNQERFGEVLARFSRMSLYYAETYATSSIPFFFCHDDIAITKGLVFAPEWYRKYIFPSYEKIFDTVHKRGKKVLFVSDGNYTSLIEDIFAAGADGIVFDHTLDIENILMRWGRTKIIVGNANAAILTLGTTEDVRREVLRCTKSARRAEAGGYVLKCSNDLPQNIPLENIEAYFDAVAEQKNSPYPVT